MGAPQPTTVRGWLAALWTLLTGWQNNTTAVVEEIRFLQRNMFGYDSTGANQPFSFLNVVSFALYPGGKNAAGEPTTHSIGEILSREFGDFSQYRVEFWLTEIRSVLRRIELHLLPSSSEPFAPGQLSEIREAINAIRLSTGFPTAQDASLGDIWQRLGALEAMLIAVQNEINSVGAPVFAIAEDVACLQEELAPNCGGGTVGFPPLPTACDPNFPDIAAVVEFTNPGITNSPTEVIIGLGAADPPAFTTGTTASGKVYLQLIGGVGVTRSFRAQIQGKAQAVGAFTCDLEPVIISTDVDGGRQMVYLDGSACDLFTLYADSSNATGNEPLGYYFQGAANVDTPGGTTDFRIVIFSGGLG